MTATLASVRVGRPRTLPGPDPWTTSFWKTAAEGPLWLGSENLDGDEQADRRVHGGPEKAVCVYSAEHYPTWRSELGLPDLGPGGFGENFTVAGQTEEDVCVGDEYAIGEATVAVSQPRGPCWKIGRRWEREDLPARVLATGRTGWYLRVVREGLVRCGDPLARLARPHPEWTIARVNEVTYTRGPAADLVATATLASCPALARSWRLWLARRL